MTPRRRLCTAAAPSITEIDRALERVTTSRASHQSWLDHWADGCDCEHLYLDTVGSAEHQRETIAGYDQVIDVLTRFRGDPA